MHGEPMLFLGLSGTGKTTLSTSGDSIMVGDDEHVWSSAGLSNIEAGCYAKCDGLSLEREPDIFRACATFGAILENVVLDERSRLPDFADLSLTANTRCAYPLDRLAPSRVRLPAAIEAQPRHVVFLVCDAFGVLPPVARLTVPQAVYHFLSGFTARVSGTEIGVKDPAPVFSACFGAPFLVHSPKVYAELFRARLLATAGDTSSASSPPVDEAEGEQPLVAEAASSCDGARVWLVNTGWSGGAFGTGSRISLRVSRAIIHAIQDGRLDQVCRTN
jgi:phosphoenolpyruvate carboxykinase (ATP)